MAANRRNKSGGLRGIFVTLAVLAVVFVLTGVGYCRTIVVRADGSGEYPTIQEAIDAAVDGDIVLVEDGAYRGMGNRGIDFRGKAITVRSENGAENCVIDCEDDNRGFYFHDNEATDSVLDGFTITNGHYYGHGGGAVSCEDSSPTITNCVMVSNVGGSKWGGRGGGAIQCVRASPIISNCIIMQNRTYQEGGGGGIYCYEYCNPQIVNCTISGNRSATYGGGIKCVYESHPIIEECIISGNSSPRSGGGISLGDSNGIIRSCVITNNSCGSHGGGIHLYGGRPTITACEITDNLSGFWGGGIFFENESNATVTHCIIAGNKATSSGGGIKCRGLSNQRIENCVIVGNAGTGGGGISADCYTISDIANCTIANNRAGYCGGAFMSGFGCDTTLTSCILWGNRAPDGSEIFLSGGWQGESPSHVFMSYSDLEGGVGDVYVAERCSFNWDNGCIDADPCFDEAGYWADVNDMNIVLEPNDANAVWVDGDYHLLEGSPCIDAGDPNYVAGPNETDLDSKPRVIRGRVDMGAYEFNHLPVGCIVGGDRFVEAGVGCEAQVVLDGSCSSDEDSTAGTNDDINDFDWYEAIDACDANSDIFLGSGEVIECNLGLGEHVIILEVADKAGAFDTNEVVITVEDVTPPEFSLSVEPNVLWPPNNKMVLVAPGWEVSDNCDESPEVSLVDITMSAEGDVNDYVQIGGDGSIYLRATKGQGGAVRIYTLTYEAVDDSGNVAIDSADVVVPHDLGRR